MPLLLTERDVRAVLPMADLIEAMGSALAAYSLYASPSRSAPSSRCGSQGVGLFAVMPAALDDPPVMGAKLVTVYHGNHERGLPSHLASIVVLDHDTGALVALMDGRYITEARTAAVSAVSVKTPRQAGRRIARDHRKRRPGAQPPRGYPSRQVSPRHAWSPTARNRDTFADEMSNATGLSIRAMGSAREALRGADLVVLATASASPVIEDDAVAGGAHICGVGACRPDQREMPTAVVKPRVFVDSRAAP